jgi:hypothetical protein
LSKLEEKLESKDSEIVKLKQQIDGQEVVELKVELG